MARVTERVLGAKGLGNIRIPHNLLGEFWRDCDKARVLDQGVITSWPGHKRQGMKFLDTTLFGAASNKLDVYHFDQEYLRKQTGHGIAVVDRASGTAGRILAVAHNSAGQNGEVMVGDPVQTTGSGLNDLDTRGVYASGPLSSSNRGIIKIKISTAAGTDKFRYSTDAGSTYSAEANITGDWQSLGATGIEIKFTATTGHTLNDVWTFTVGGRPMLAGTMNRQGPHNYPTIIPAQSGAMFFTPWDRVKVDGREGFRNAGIRAPKIKPVITAKLSGTDTPSSTSGTEIGANPASWVGVNSCVISTGTVSPSPVNGANYVKVAIPSANSKGSKDLAYINAAGTIDSTTKRVRVYLYGDFTRGHIPDKRLSLIFASAVALGGTRKELKILNTIHGKRWTRCDCRWSETADFTYASVGLRMRHSIHKIGDLYSGGNLDLYLDWLTTDESGGAGTTETSELFKSLEGQGAWRFCHTNRRSSDGRESAPSPWSDPIELDGTALVYDASGYYPGIQAGLKNTLPDSCDEIVIYATNASLGQDPRTGRGYSFRMLGPPIPSTSLTDPASLGQLIYDFHDPEEKLDFATVSQNRLAPFFNGLPMPGEVAIEDNGIIISALTPNYSVGQMAFTNGSGLVTPVSSGDPETTPVIGTWMEGRKIWRKGDTRTYRIIKALDTDGDGDYEGLWIGTDFDEVRQDFATLYQGTTTTGAGYVILGDDRQVTWTNKLSSGEIDPEASSVFNFLKAFDGDGIVGGGKVDEFVFIIGHAGAAVLRQNPSAFADAPFIVADEKPVAPVPSYVNPVHLAGVTMMARRTFCLDSDGNAYWMGAKGELFKATKGSAVQRHPLSDALASLLDGYGLISDTVSLRNSFAKYVRRGGEEYILLCVCASEKTPGTGVVSFFEDAYDFGATDGADTSVATEDGYDYPWATDNGANPNPYNGLSAKEPMPPAHWLPFSPRPFALSGGTYKWTDPWGKVIGVDAGALTVPWDEYQSGSGGSVTQANFPATKDQEDGVNAEWPSPGTSDPHYHRYEFNRSDYKCYKFNIKATATTAKLFESFRLSVDGVAPWQFIPATCKKLGFWAYADQAVAADKLKILVDNDTDFSWNLPAIPQNQWTWVEVDLEANPPPWWGFAEDFGGSAAFNVLDKEGNVLNGIYYQGITLNINSVFGVETNIYVTGGRLLFGDSELIGAPVEPFSSTVCTDIGASLPDDALGTDFETAFLIDLKRGAVFAGTEARFTCPSIEVAASCSVAGQMDAPVFLGTRDAYIHLACEDSVLFWGAPEYRNVWGVDADDPGGAATVNVDRHFRGVVDELSLPTDIDGSGTLAGLLVAKVSEKDADGFRVIEYRRASSNTVGTITVSEDWDAVPVETDTIIIAPLPFTWHSGEIRGRQPLILREITMDLDSERSENTPGDIPDIDPHCWLSLWAAADGENKTFIHDDPVLQKSWVASDLKAHKGWLGVSPVAGKALSYELTVLGGMTGRTRVSNVKVRERMEDGEVGR